MTRMLVLMVTWWVLAMGVVHAVPARPLFEPAEYQHPLDLRGTTWKGQDHVPNYQITFETDGTVTYGYNTKAKRGGSWVLEGNKLYFELNKQYREFRGTVDGNVLQGESWNKAGKRWQTHLQRVPAQK